jgi:hypothetical protein
MRIFRYFPLFIPVLVLVNALYHYQVDLDSPLVGLTALSGANLTFNGNQLILVGSLFLLYVEILKSTRNIGTAISDHIFSIATFVLFLLEFLLFPPAGNVSFLVLMLLCLLDVLAGVTVGISMARSNFTIGQR